MDLDSNIWAQLILIVVLICINAFFAAAEMAIVSVNKNKIKILAEDGHKKAILLEKLLQEPTRFLSTIQVGITFAGFFSSATAAVSLSNGMGAFLASYNIPYGQQISLVLITLILSFLTLVFGELFPKRVALQQAEKVALSSVNVIVVFQKITSIFIKLLSLTTNLLLKMFGFNTEGMDEQISKEEIRSMVEVGQENGVFNATEKEMIDSIFEFDDKIAEKVMTPRTKVYSININRPLNEYLDELINEKYSRVPVYDEDIDKIIGVLYMKDFMVEARRVGFDQVDIRSILHPAYFVPERKNIDVLFKELQTNKVHMAMLIDEYGGFSGIITIEDLIEEVMGEIDDEYDEDDIDIKKITNFVYLVNGTTLIEEINDTLHLDLNEDSDDYDTIGGFVVNLMDSIPNDDDKRSFNYKNVTFKIEKVTDKRIEKLKIIIHNEVKEELD